MGIQLNLVTILGLILGLSVLLAYLSMRDFDVPKEIKKRIKTKRIKGTIVFFKDKPRHYSSSSSASSRE